MWGDSMKKIAAIAIALLFILSGCSTSNAAVKVKDIDPASEVKNIPYSIRQQTSFVISKDYIQSHYGNPKVVRDAGEYSYEIRDMIDGSKLFVIYNKKTGTIHDIWRLKTLLTRSDFEDIQPGKSTFEDVQKIDPYSQDFGASTGEAISEHRLINNEVAIIHYTKKNNKSVVNSIKYVSPDPSGFYSILFPDDLGQILPD